MFKRLSDGTCISANPSPLKDGGLHETFKVDEYGNIIDLHTTVEVSGAPKIRLDTGGWDIQKTSYESSE